MSKLKQKYNAYQTALSLYNKRKVNLSNEFSHNLAKAYEQDDIERFEALADEMVRTLGKEYSTTVTSIKVLYEMNGIFMTPKN